MQYTHYLWKGGATVPFLACNPAFSLYVLTGVQKGSKCECVTCPVLTILKAKKKKFIFWNSPMLLFLDLE